MLQNGQTTAEIQEEVALTSIGSSSAINKRHSSSDKMHFSRSSLQTITPLGMLYSSHSTLYLLAVHILTSSSVPSNVL